MSRFATTLFSGSRFIFRSLGPFLLLGGLTFLGPAVRASPGGGRTSRIGLALLGLFCLACVPVLYDPVRYRTASRALTGVVFLAYLGYFLSEAVWHAGDIGVGEARSAPTPLNAARGLLVIGLPCLWWTLLGRLSLRQAPGCDPSAPGSTAGGRTA